MKKMHKLLALALALIMALAMATTALADDPTGGKLTITGADTSTVTYVIYKVCDVEVVDPSENATYKYSLAPDWVGFTEVEGFSDYFTTNTVDGKIYLNWKSKNASDADGAAVAQMAKKYAEDNHLSPLEDKEAKVNSGSVSLDEDGYYLLVPNDGTTCGVVVVAGEDKVIHEKSTAPGLPTVSKMVQEDSTNTYGSANDVDIGQKITFQTTITAGGSNSNFILHDKMDKKHMQWLGGGNITRDGNLLVRGENADNPGDYYVVSNPTDGCTFHVIFNDKLTNTLHDGAALVVNYFAVLTTDPDFSHSHMNETWLTYTAQNASTNKASTVTNTYKIRVVKEDQDHNPLAGASFVLKDNVNKYYSWGSIDLGDGKITTGVIWVDDINQATVVEATAEEQTDGTTIYVAEFPGVDAENFTVIETVVPGGYTGAGEVSVSTKTGVKNGVATVVVQNVLGNALPETGGMGTTLFYILGGLLAAGAAILLVTKKRVGTAE